MKTFQMLLDLSRFLKVFFVSDLLRWIESVCIQRVTKNLIIADRSQSLIWLWTRFSNKAVHHGVRHQPSSLTIVPSIPILTIMQQSTVTSKCALVKKGGFSLPFPTSFFFIFLVMFFFSFESNLIY